MIGKPEKRTNSQASEPSLPGADEGVERRERLLDDALKDTFPASDPPSIVAPH
jgi:hypothetical protein